MSHENCFVLYVSAVHVLELEAKFCRCLVLLLQPQCRGHVGRAELHFHLFLRLLHAVVQELLQLLEVTAEIRHEVRGKC
jgi:hypothetical protein